MGNLTCTTKHHLRLVKHEAPRDHLTNHSSPLAAIVKLGEFEVADGLALNAFGSEPFLVLGHEHAEPQGWRDMWTERLERSDGSKPQVCGG